jgi:hypothetical protein
MKLPFNTKSEENALEMTGLLWCCSLLGRYRQGGQGLLAAEGDCTNAFLGLRSQFSACCLPLPNQIELFEDKIMSSQNITPQCLV